jgi:hypothetical protein
MEIEASVLVVVVADNTYVRNPRNDCDNAELSDLYGNRTLSYSQCQCHNEASPNTTLKLVSVELFGFIYLKEWTREGAAWAFLRTLRDIVYGADAVPRGGKAGKHTKVVSYNPTNDAVKYRYWKLVQDAWTRHCMGRCQFIRARKRPSKNEPSTDLESVVTTPMVGE